MLDIGCIKTSANTLSKYYLYLTFGHSPSFFVFRDVFCLSLGFIKLSKAYIFQESSIPYLESLTSLITPFNLDLSM